MPLFPESEPWAVHRLAVGDGHTLHVEESAAVDGLPVVFLHGGPGSGCSPVQRRLFDPARYRIVVKADGERTNVSVQNAQGGPETGPVGQQIVARLESVLVPVEASTRMYARRAAL